MEAHPFNELCVADKKKTHGLHGSYFPPINRLLEISYKPLGEFAFKPNTFISQFTIGILTHSTSN